MGWNRACSVRRSLEVRHVAVEHRVKVERRHIDLPSDQFREKEVTQRSEAAVRDEEVMHEFKAGTGRSGEPSDWFGTRVEYLELKEVDRPRPLVTGRGSPAQLPQSLLEWSRACSRVEELQ